MYSGTKVELHPVKLKNDVLIKENKTSLFTNFENISHLNENYLIRKKIPLMGEVFETQSFPLIVAWLLGGALFFTLRLRFINVRLFAHAINLVRGKYDDGKKKASGEVTHFQALTTALSATVGLGKYCWGCDCYWYRWSRSNFLDDPCWISWNVFQIHRMLTWTKISKNKKRWKDYGGGHALFI